MNLLESLFTLLVSIILVYFIGYFLLNRDIIKALLIVIVTIHVYDHQNVINLVKSVKGFSESVISQMPDFNGNNAAITPIVS
jgi:hypothetical protein